MSHPPDGGAKKIVLARRARFIAAAVAGLGLACGKEKAAPCLSIAQPQDAAPLPEPTPCLSAPIPHEPSEPDAEPRPCLSIAPPIRDAGSSKKR